MRLIRTAGFLAVFTCRALAQSSNPAVFGAGYVSGGVVVAPGQVIPFYLSGLTVSGGPVSATTLPLPYTLAGISAVIDTGAAKFPVPIFAVSTLPNCPAFPLGAQCQAYTAVTVEIPVELPANSYPSGGVNNSYTLYFTDSLGNSALISVHLYADQIHILGNCGVFGCTWVYTEADGTTPSTLNAGDTIIIYAYGLGYTTPPVPSGTATPSNSLSPVTFIGIDFDFTPNAGPPRFQNNLSGNPVRGFSAPLFAGLVPGYVGLYQVNVTIPDIPAGTPACSGSPPVVSTNLSISLIEPNSVDGIGVCVNPPPTVASAEHRTVR